MFKWTYLIILMLLFFALGLIYSNEWIEVGTKTDNTILKYNTATGKYK